MSGPSGCEVQRGPVVRSVPSGPCGTASLSWSLSPSSSTVRDSFPHLRGPTLARKGAAYLELNLYVGLVGAGLIAMDPPSILSRSSGFIRNAWHHGGPTSSFIHLVSAFCFLLPKIFIDGKLIQVGFLPK
ncbi:Uncharacterized protein FKW44_010788, partial [Caligus rogercresseyi]